MFDLGMQELIVIFIVALLVFGPKKLPELGRNIGKAIGELKRAMHGVKEQIDAEINVVKEPLSLDEIYKAEEKREDKKDVKGEAEENLTKEGQGELADEKTTKG